MGLARLELAVVLATWVQRADLRLGPGPVHPVRTSFLYEPANGLQVELVGKR
jgi:cytochrome P450